MNQINTISEVLRSQIALYDERLSNPSLSEYDREFYLGLRAEATSNLEKLNIESYGLGLRTAQIALITRLRGYKNQFGSDHLLRRSFLGALYNTCSTALFERSEFLDLKQYFPSLKLPLALSKEDYDSLNELNLKGLPLKVLFRKYLEFYEPFRFSRPEDHLRVWIWAPLLTDLLSFVSVKYQNFDFIAVNKLSTRLFHSMSLTRFVDFSACSRGPNGILLFLCEMAESEVPTAGVHKDFRKLSILMVFALSELINRAGILFPDEELTKFRVYGTLISGRIFDLCVCTVIKGDDGKYGFVFHSNEFHWKFALFGSEIRIPADEIQRSKDFICEGVKSIITDFVDMSPDMVNARTIFDEIVDENFLGILLEGIESDIADKADLSQFGDKFTGPDDSIDRPLLVLLRFFEEMMDYYTSLPECLRTAYISIPDTFPEFVLRFPKYLPHLPKSQVGHSRASPELYHHVIINEAINGPRFEFYRLLAEIKFPTLPDVIFFDKDNGTFFCRKYLFEIDDTIKLFNKSFDGKRLELEIAKLILDLLMGIFEIHSRDLVCGCVEPSYICYDLINWRFSSLPRLVTVSEANSVNVKCFYDYSIWYHMNESGLSQRDDLFSLAVIMCYKLRGKMRKLLENFECYPLFAKFIKGSFIKMYEYANYPEITASDILQESTPIFEEMLNQLGTETDIVLFKMTLKLAKDTLKRINSSSIESMTSSIETVAISLESEK